MLLLPRFDLESAVGPFKLDLGNVLYAPFVFYDQASCHLCSILPSYTVSACMPDLPL